MEQKKQQSEFYSPTEKPTEYNTIQEIAQLLFDRSHLHIDDRFPYFVALAMGVDYIGDRKDLKPISTVLKENLTDRQLEELIELLKAKA